MDLAGALAEQLLLPMLAGGEVHPVEPIGPERARELAAAQAVVTVTPALEEVMARRLRAARVMLPVDALGDLTPGEWLLACALNDLLQVTNPNLTGWFGADRPERLLELVDKTVELAGPARTVGDAVARHATFGRAVDLVRIDTRVSWWTGSQDFFGARPSPRLLVWKRLRRVTTREEQVSLFGMAYSGATWSEHYMRGLSHWLAATPLTDLATAARHLPPFAWRGSSLALIDSPLGRNLARRVVSRSPEQNATISALRERAKAIDKRARGPVKQLLRELGVKEKKRAARAS